MSIVRLKNVAAWHAEKGCALLRQSGYIKDPAVHAEVMRTADRHMRNHDDIKRDIFLLEHRKKK